MAKKAAILCCLMAVPLLGLWLEQPGLTLGTAGYLKAIWVAQAQGLVKVAAEDGTVRLVVTDAAGARAMAVDEARERLWVIAQGTLRAYAFDGGR